MCPIYHHRFCLGWFFPFYVRLLKVLFKSTKTDGKCAWVSLLLRFLSGLGGSWIKYWEWNIRVLEGRPSTAILTQRQRNFAHRFYPIKHPTIQINNIYRQLQQHQNKVLCVSRSKIVFSTNNLSSNQEKDRTRFPTKSVPTVFRTRADKVSIFDIIVH